MLYRVLEHRQNDEASEVQVPLVFCHSIVGFVPIPSLRLLKFGLGLAELWVIVHPGFIDGVSFDDFSIEDQSLMYAKELHQARGDAPFDLCGASWGASMAHLVATAAQAIGAFARALLLIDPNPAPPYLDEFFAREAISPHHAAFNCIFGTFEADGERIKRAADEIFALPEDSLGAYVAKQYEKTGGIRGTTWDAILCTRQIKVYMHCSRSLTRLTRNSIPHFVGYDGGSSIMLVRATHRQQFFFEQVCVRRREAITH